jgi:SAM-dependent methyltransferase
MKKQMWIWLLVAFFTTTLVMVSQYMRESTQRWFSEDLPDAATVQGWSHARLDVELHELSRWDGFTPDQFRRFVEHQIAGLRIPQHEPFKVLEVGVGVGAFARHFLRLYPNATGWGVDIEPKAIAIARAVLPEERMELGVVDMRRLPFCDAIFDYVLVPGALCYLHTLWEVQEALHELFRVLKPGGGLCASMLASEGSPMGSCTVRIPAKTWTLLPAFSCMREPMDGWALPHSLGRYAVCMRKDKPDALPKC